MNEGNVSGNLSEIPFSLFMFIGTNAIEIMECDGSIT